MDVRWTEGTQLIAMHELQDSYQRYRLGSGPAERSMRVSLERYGQLSPVVTCRRDGKLEVLDGFKRLVAARELRWKRLSTRLLDVDERGAKAAIYGLNQVGGRTQELEEAWIVHALVRDDGLSQVGVAELLGRHKSWVCRRLALVERLSEQVREELRLGLLTPTTARELVRLPRGNQSEMAEVVQRHSLTRVELQELVDLSLRCRDDEQRQRILERPRDALESARGAPRPAPCDPRLSPAGNRLAKSLAYLLEQLARMQGWLFGPGPGNLTESDRAALGPSLEQLARSAGAVAERSRELYSTTGTPP